MAGNIFSSLCYTISNLGCIESSLINIALIKYNQHFIVSWIREFDIILIMIVIIKNSN